MASNDKKERAKVRRRLKGRRGNVLFIENMPDGLKDWLKDRAARNPEGSSMVGEAVAILVAARAAEQPGAGTS